MDAEIGVRNLVDSFRYNALPDIIELTTGKEMDDLPEYEKLALMVCITFEIRNIQADWYSRVHKPI